MRLPAIRAHSLVATAATMVLLAAALPEESSAAQPTPGRAGWLRAETPSFTLFGEVPEARLRAIAGRLETYRAALEWLHPGSAPSPRETSVFVFKDTASGARFALPGLGAGHHLGVNPPYDVPNFVVVAAPTDDPPLEILYHGYAHQFLDDNFPGLPLSITEGLAEFYSGFRTAPEGTLLGVSKSEHVLWLKEHPLMGLARQLSLEPGDPLLADKAGLSSFMAGSWALMHYLVSGSGEKRVKLPEFIGALRQKTPPAAAALAAYGWSLERLQEEVEGYVRRDHDLPIRVALEARRPAVLLRPLAEDETDAALGDLLAHAAAGGAVEAEKLFAEALRLNPSQPGAQSGLGYLRYAQGRFEDAVPRFEKAIEVEPDAMSCYLLARSLLKIHAADIAAIPASGGTPPWLLRIRTLLARASLLRPGFAAPYVTLGATHMYPDGDVAAGIELLQKARAMLPARMDIAGNLVYLYLRHGDAARAQALVDRVMAPGGDAEALRSARQALATYQQNLKAKRSIAENAHSPEEEERLKQMRAVLAKQFRETLASTTDPEKRAIIEKQLRLLEAPPVQTIAEMYNEAVEKANNRDYAGAIALLEQILPNAGDEELSAQIKNLLERLRQDAARLQQPVK